MKLRSPKWHPIASDRLPKRKMPTASVALIRHPSPCQRLHHHLITVCVCVSSHQILIVLNTYKCYRMSSERALRALKCSGRFCCCPIINEFIMLSTMLTNWYFNAAKFSMPFCWVVSVSIYLYVLHGRLEILLLVDVAWRKHHHPATANSSPAPPNQKLFCFQK